MHYYINGERNRRNTANMQVASNLEKQITVSPKRAKE